MRPTASKYPELVGLHGIEYRKKWNKIHRALMREVARKFRQTEKGKACTKRSRIKQRGSLGRKRRRAKYNVQKNNESRKRATMAYQRWGAVEDAMLYSGLSHSRLVHELGRSILAIQLRKHRLKKLDNDETDNQRK